MFSQIAKSPARTLLALASAGLMLFGISCVTTIAMAQSASPPAPTGAAGPDPERQVPDLAALDFGKALVTQRCANCHALAEGEDRYSAPLHHLFGRDPGSIEGYTFSINMKNIGIAWSPSTLDNWLEQTTFNTPDIRMRHVGIINAVQRAAVIEYLKSLPGNAGAAQK